jgi:periplasmic protein TonB
MGPWTSSSVWYIKQKMSHRFLTHLSTILGVHLLILFGWSFSQSENLIRSLPQIGPAALKLQVASQVLMPQIRPKPTPVPKKSVAAPAPQAEIQPQVESRPEQSVSSNQRADIRSEYHAELRARIDENKYYPPLSRRLGQKGTVIVAFTLLEDGNIVNVRIDTPSNFERLNESALDAVKKVGRFKPIPLELRESKMDIKVPVKFFTI